MLNEALVDGVVGWLVAMVGTATVARTGDRVLGTRQSRKLQDALTAALPTVIAQLPEDAQEDLAVALRERMTLPPVSEVRGAGPREVLDHLLDLTLAPLALPGQTLAIHRIDYFWLKEAILDTLLETIGRLAVEQGQLADLAQLIGIERIEMAQARLERMLAVSARHGVPHNLPRPARHFAGRDEVVSTLIRHATAVEAGGLLGIPVQLIEGMGGIGKTEIALQVAHMLTERFPDAQLYVDLQTFTPGLAPLSPLKALESLMIAAGVPPEQIPTGLTERAAAWRRRLAGRRTIVVLDDANDVGQVKPLIPGAPSCLVLVTSRRRIYQLDDAEVIALEGLDPAAGAKLFASVAGIPAHVEDPDVERVVELCGRLPLAIRLAASRVRRRSDRGLSRLVTEMAGTRRNLYPASVGGSEIHAAFDVSYRSLDPNLQVAFRRLGLHPGPDIVPDFAAALIDVSLAEAEALLDRLLIENLLLETTAGRVVLHDLVRQYALNRAQSDDSLPDIQAAVGRLTTLFASKVGTVSRFLSPSSRDDERSGSAWARRWLSTERANLVAMVERAQEQSDRFAIDVARSIGDHLIVLGYVDDAERVFGAASAVSAERGDDEASAMSMLGLGEVNRFTGRYGAARELFFNARRISDLLGDQQKLARACYGLGEIARSTGDYAEAEDFYARATQASAVTEDLRLEADALRGQAEVAQARGAIDEARELYTRSHSLCTTADNRLGQIFALLGLGEVERTAGHFPTSAVHYEVARTLAVDTGDLRAQANASYGLGEVALDVGDLGAAADRFAETYRITAELQNRRGQAYAQLGLGRTSLSRADYAQVPHHAEIALELCRDIGDRGGEARALLLLGDLAAARGDRLAATESWRESRRIAGEAVPVQLIREIERRPTME